MTATARVTAGPYTAGPYTVGQMLRDWEAAGRATDTGGVFPQPRLSPRDARGVDRLVDWLSVTHGRVELADLREAVARVADDTGRGLLAVRLIPVGDFLALAAADEPCAA